MSGHPFVLDKRYGSDLKEVDFLRRQWEASARYSPGS